MHNEQPRREMYVDLETASRERPGGGCRGIPKQRRPWQRLLAHSAARVRRKTGSVGLQGVDQFPQHGAVLSLRQTHRLRAR